MEITTELIKELRDKTGVSVMQCKKALEETGGDIQKAILVLQKKSKDIANKKSDRTLGAGVVASYIHATGTVGTMLELFCETDFVANNEEFKKLARDIAMHVTATNPQFAKKEDIDETAQAQAKEMFEKDVDASKPADVKAKILEGKLSAYWGERVLLDQPFVKNPEVTISGLLESAIQKFGEKMEVGRFVRYSVK